MGRGVYIILMNLFVIQFGNAQYKFGKVPDEIVLQTEHQVEKNASAAVIYREMKTKFNYLDEKGFQLQTEVHEIVKIYNSEGYDWTTVEIPMYKANNSSKELVSGLKGYTYTVVNGEVEKIKLDKNGIFEEERSKYWNVKKFTMPNIQDGVVIEYTYKFLSPFTANINEYRFQEKIPVDLVSMEFYAPEWMVYKTHRKGWIPLNIREESKERILRYKYNVEREGSALVSQGSRRQEEVRLKDKGYSLKLKDVPAVKIEPFSGNIENYTSGLQMELEYTKFPGANIKGYTTTWEDVAKNIYQSPDFGKELAKTNYFVKTINPLISNLNSPREKLASIYQYIRANYAWNGISGVYTDNGVSKAFKEKSGNVADINLMLTAMLRHAGIDANPVLISTKSNGVPIFPTRNGFNYVISGAIIGNNLILLDGTDKIGNINILKDDLLNWQGRMIRKDGSSSLVNLMPNKPAVHTAMLDFKFDEDFMLSGKSQNRYTGHFAKDMRNALISLSDDEVLSKIEENLNGAEASEIEIKELKNVYKPISTSFEIEEMEAAELIGDKLYFSPALYLADNEDYFKSEERKYPIDFSYPKQDKYIISIEIPEGYAVESLPEPIAVNFADNMGSFRYQIQEQGGKLNLSIQRMIGTPMVLPSSYFDLKNFFKIMKEKENEKVVLKKI